MLILFLKQCVFTINILMIIRNHSIIIKDYNLFKLKKAYIGAEPFRDIAKPSNSNIESICINTE